MALTSSKIKRYIKDTYRRQRRRVKKVVLAAPFWVLAAGIVLTSIGIGRYAFLAGNRHDQNMAAYWTTDDTTSFRYMSVYARGARPGGARTAPVYINQNVSLKRSDIVAIRTALQSCADSGTSSAGKSGLGTDGRPRGWEDCFSSYLSGTVTSVPDPDSTYIISTTSACDIIAVEGNFTAFHPLRFMSGGFLPEIADDPRQIVINDVLAWKFYKSYDVVGEQLKLWGEEFTIIGVVAEPSDRISRSCGTLDPRVYVYFSAMENLAPLIDPGDDFGDTSAAPTNTPAPTQAPAAEAATGSDSAGSTRPDMAILCYEAMLPEAVSGVAKTDMSNSVTHYTPATPNFYIISNTGRFRLNESWKFVWPIGKTEALLADYEFPYWEKAAQLTSQHLFADEIVTGVGVIVLITGTFMAALRFRKMSRK